MCLLIWKLYETGSGKLAITFILPTDMKYEDTEHGELLKHGGNAHNFSYDIILTFLCFNNFVLKCTFIFYSLHTRYLQLPDYCIWYCK